ncbi:methylenetetrahydrofolate reductase-like [Actinia tenebrosa]|uniref:Methylenetetrahydrofolate reductase-like n=1 Tax=Actinia tenebrosa TaxID=6105 RepID=A0A6P8IWR0_ACTTE|nr:methylenetetrahydrofolate reductase-like [Actinia tenebrosa]XP_031571841.1 methylenetetrahydrofolate reductase-like [Actinia tenebrosa]
MANNDNELCTGDKIASKELLDKINECQGNGKFFSVEFFPPKTFNGATNLCAILYRLHESNTIPMFVDITWKPSEDPLSDTCQEPTALLICSASRQISRFNTMIHIPYYETTKTQVFEHLLKAKELGVCGIRALRRGPASLKEDDIGNIELKDGFSSTEQLIRFVKHEFGHHFTIAVTGYPSGFKTKSSYEEDLRKLKIEVDAGADFITTQMFFEVDFYFNFVKDCRNIGINVPIIPGIFPIQSVSSLRQLKRTLAVNIPDHIFESLTPIKDDNDAVIDFGVQYAVNMCQQLLASCDVPGIHFYTFNLETALKRITQNLDLGNSLQHNETCSDDNVRPIFWATRPRSYLIRTSNWDEMPNGRWGDSSAASFGQIKDYHLFLMGTNLSRNDLLNMWGRELHSFHDVCEIFVCYLTGKENRHGYKVTQLPWAEDEIATETMSIVKDLVDINKEGILTINSQPCVNGAPSDDPRVGWGKPGGYVFQKAYIEFFAREEVANEIYKQLKDSKRINFHMVKSCGDNLTNANIYSPNAVTWGVFPGSEVIQPTVVDPIAFQFWKDEAFALWNQQWRNLYPEGSPSRDVIKTIQETFYLINLVDNDYVAGNSLFDVLNNVLTSLKHETS